MDSDCVLSAEFDSCYYISPAYSRTLSQSPGVSTSNSCSSTRSGSNDGDRGRLISLINQFNTNNHGLIMTLVRSVISH